MNGDISNLDGIIATQSDFEKYIDSHHIMLMFFKRELISSTFLFIGYSFTDHLVLDCLSEIQRYFPHIDPSFLNTTCIVFSRILKSSPMLQWLMYSLSSSTTSSKSVMLLRPLTCHIPVRPGFAARRAR